MSDFTRILRPGTIPSYNGRRVNVFVKVEFRDGKLSITGVEGPRANGDAEACGQIAQHYRHADPSDNDSRYGDALMGPDDFDFADGWDAEKWLALLDIWGRWHLNDMTPMCEHQRSLGWADRAKTEVKIYHWQLHRDASAAQGDLKAGALEALALGETVAWDERVRELLALPYWTTTVGDEPPLRPGRTASDYEPRSDRSGGPVETKTLGWLRPNEHPDGILTRPCPECGYGYGTEWRSEIVPGTVLRFLQELPDADKTPAWI